MMRNAAFVALALPFCLIITAARGEVVDIRLDPPRTHGWWIGDVLTARTEIAMDAGFTLDPASLPRPRAVDYWLTLRAARVIERTGTGGRKLLTLALEYQTFYAAMEPKAMTVPAEPLVFSRGEERLEKVVPAWNFVSSPLREIRAPATPDAMAPAPPVAMVDPGNALTDAIGASIIGLGSLLGLAWHRGAGPFRRRARPFGKAAARMGRVRDWRGEPLRGACVDLHRAFDAALGRRMLADDVPALIAARPELAFLADGITDFFAASRLLIFGGGGPSPALERAALTRLVHDLAAVERRRP